MTVSQWIAENSDLLQICGLAGTVLLSAYATFKDERARQVSNSIAIAAMHQKLWREFRERPERLSRVVKPDVDLEKNPITDEESSFASSLIMHLGMAFKARKAGMLAPIDGLNADVRAFFLLPIPKAVWESSKGFQNADFVRFVDKITGTSF